MGPDGLLQPLTRLGDNLDFVVIDYPGGHGPLGKGLTMIHSRTRQEVEPRFLDGRLLPETERSDPRKRLAKWITSAENPYFAEAAVNRIWSYFFREGMVNPVDDFRASNAPTQPTLLRALAEDFKEHAYDLKHLLRVIVQSQTHQLSQKPNETNRDDKLNNSRSLPRPLDAEVLWDAINQFVGVEEDLEQWRGGRASTRTRVINLVSPGSVPRGVPRGGPDIRSTLLAGLWTTFTVNGARTDRRAKSAAGVAHTGRFDLYQQAGQNRRPHRPAACKRRFEPAGHRRAVSGCSFAVPDRTGANGS